MVAGNAVENTQNEMHNQCDTWPKVQTLPGSSIPDTNNADNGDKVKIHIYLDLCTGKNTKNNSNSTR